MFRRLVRLRWRNGDEEELIQFVVKNAQKDGVGKFEAEEITFIVQGELEYCDSLNMFD